MEEAQMGLFGEASPPREAGQPAGKEAPAPRQPEQPHAAPPQQHTAVQQPEPPQAVQPEQPKEVPPAAPAIATGAGKTNIADDRARAARRKNVVEAATRGRAVHAAKGARGKAAQAAKKVSGLVPEGDVRLTANIREDLHLKLKIASAYRRTTIGEIIEELIEKYV